jgi:16S rRNA (cytosine967-C5)-methyltransferase
LLHAQAIPLDIIFLMGYSLCEKKKVLMKVSFSEHHLFQLLKRFDTQHLPLDLFLSHYFRAHTALGSKDRQLIAHAVYGMSRWKSLLDYLIGPNPSWEKRYALFRSFQPTNYLIANHIPLHIRLSFPKELLTLLEEGYGGEKAVYLAQVCNTEAPITVRANLLKTTPQELLAKWQPLYEVSPCKRAPSGIQFKKRLPLTSLPEFKEGHFEIQDEASQLVSTLIQAQPGEQVLDYCAGAGGKTLAFAHQMENQGQIYLHDIRPPILEQARKRLKRAGIQNGQFLPAGHSALQKLKKKMDWVLVDVPCSGTGTLRRNPDQKWKFSLALLNRLVGQQRMIFEKGLSYLKPGGKIVYSTCSLLQSENERQVEHFLQTYNLKLDSPPFVSLPSYEGMDGFFAAVLTSVKKPSPCT